MAGSLGHLVKVRSQLATEVLDYLRELAGRLGALPDYYPPHLLRGRDGQTGFEGIRQVVRVIRDRKPFERDLAQKLRHKAYQDGPARARPEEASEWAARREEPETLTWDGTTGAEIRRAVILGDPGAGKTWLLRYEGWPLARSGADQVEASQVSLDDLVFPIFVHASLLKGRRRPMVKCLVTVCRGKRSAAFGDYVLAKFEAERCVVLVDAWDEVTNPAEHQAVGENLRQFAADFPKPRLLLTSRIVGYSSSPFADPEARELELVAFDMPQIESFVRVWFADQPEKAGQMLAALNQEVNRRVRGLARIPLLLTLLCRTCAGSPLPPRQRGRTADSFPTRRVELYERALWGLLKYWKQEKQGQQFQEMADEEVEALMGHLQRAAFKLQWDQKELFQTKDLGEALSYGLPKPLGERRTVQVLSRLKGDGVLTRVGEEGSEVWLFLHRTFQEYLAGAYLAGRPAFATQAAARAPQREQWREVTLLASAELVFLCRDARKALALIEELCPAKAKQTGAGWYRAWLAGEVLLEIGWETSEARTLWERVRHRLAELLEAGALKVKERAAAGVVLGKLGDPRKGVGLDKDGLPDVDWVPIEPGTFKMGGKESWVGGLEFECGGLKDRPYRMSRYPVTVAQFEAFVRAEDGYRDPRWWHGLAWQPANGTTAVEYRGYPEVFQTLNHPVVGVNWYETIAFCRWLSLRLKELPTGHPKRLTPEKRITLPSEAEWERAARGRTGKVYAWGNDATEMEDRCNCWESGLGATCAVGMFPVNRSEEGVQDLTGNVWEWTRSLWGENLGTATYAYPYNPDDGREKVEAPAAIGRVLRGGSWVGGDPGDLRAARRVLSPPGLRIGSFGFRCVVVGSGPEAG